MLKVCICLAIPLFLFGFNAYEDRNFSSLCNLYRQKARAMYYGDYGGARSIQDRIESYKMRFGIEEFDETECEIPEWNDWIPYHHYRQHYNHHYRYLPR